jgi:hypothetical protein
LAFEAASTISTAKPRLINLAEVMAEAEGADDPYRIPRPV